MNEIIRNSPVPAYYQIALDLRDRIHRQEWKKGDQIPPEPELAKEYCVSRVTLRQAIAELVKDGLLIRFQGRGTFITNVPQPLVHDLSLPIKFAGQLRQLGYTLSSQVLEAERIEQPYPEVIERLKIPTSQSVAFLKRLLLINEQPVAINRSWFSEILCPGIASEGLIDNSLSGTLAQKYHLIPAHSENWLESVRATEREAKLLETSPDTPLILLSTVSILSSGSPLEYSTTSWVGDRIRFHFNVDFQSGGSVVKVGMKEQE